MTLLDLPALSLETLILQHVLLTPPKSLLLFALTLFLDLVCKHLGLNPFPISVPFSC